MLKRRTFMPRERKSYTPILGIIFVVFGGILLAKLAKYQFQIWRIDSEMIYQLSFIEWVVAIGSFLGGLYMLYMSLFMRRIYIR